MPRRGLQHPDVVVKRDHALNWGLVRGLLERHDPVRTVFRTLQLLGFGLVVGTILGWLACAVLSNGHAAPSFYITYGVFGAIVGILGSIVGGLAIVLGRR